MKIIRFEDIVAWQKGQTLSVLVYNSFKTIKDYSFKDQIFRASVSISNNIAEGFERNSKKDFIRFLVISKGSNSEVKSMLYLAKKLEFINEENFKEMIGLTNEIGKILSGFINSLNPENN